MPKSTRKSSAVKSPRTKKAIGSTRSAAAKTCDQCGVTKGTLHVEDCPNGRCAECGSSNGHMLTCRLHAHYGEPVLDGKTGGPIIDTTVDGVDAKIKVTDADEEEKPKPQGLKRLPPPALTDVGIFEALQYAIDKKIIFGVKQALTTFKPCEVQWWDEESAQSVGCSANAVFDFESLDTCESCKHTKKKVLESFCIAHMGARIAGDLLDRQINMFDQNGEK